MRSKLFVPGSRPEFLAKAMASNADGISIDLEDAVVEARKSEARRTVSDWLSEGVANPRGKTLIVRVNALDTPHFEDDILAVVRPGVHMVNLPKAETPEAVRAACAAITRAERLQGVAARIGLLVNIETPRGLHRAAELAQADPRVCGLQLGLADLFEPFGIDRTDVSAVQQTMFAVRMAAAQAGLPAWDAAFANVNDDQGFRAEAALARRMGFTGKTCIHPSQIALANEAFQPGAAEIEQSLRILSAATKADAQGLGAYLVDGRMIDAPFLQRARDVVASARRFGLIAEK
jgi:citrate lyase subunit beta/citryl-CoA lyase